MKYKSIRRGAAAALILALVLGLAGPAAKAAGEQDSPPAAAAIQAGLIPVCLQGGCRAPVTRGIFCILAVRLLDALAAGQASGAPTQAQARAALLALRADYPEGMPWTNDDYYYSQAMDAAGLGCEAFALLCSDAAFGTLPAAEHASFDRIRVGDVIRIGDYHTVVVLEKQPGAVVVVEGNYDSSIHWGRTITRAELEQEGFSVRTRYPGSAGF